MSSLGAGPPTTRPVWSGTPLWLPHTVLALCGVATLSLRSPDVPRSRLPPYTRSVHHLFLWQGTLLHPPCLSSLLINLRSRLQCYFLKKLPVVSQPGSDVLVITLLFTCTVPSYLSCNFICISVIV